MKRDEQTRREELYINLFLDFLESDLTKRDWTSLGKRFTEATGLDILSGLGTLFKGFVLGLESAEGVLKQIDEYARGGGVI